jgi:RNA polymerase sigma-70 factor (ECF subfamily)
VLADTNTYLLMGLKDQGNGRVWEEFCARYRPVLVSFALRLGFSVDDAQDAAQESLLAFVESYRKGRYDRQKGRLRTWLLAIARNQMLGARRRAKRLHTVEPEGKAEVLASIPGEDELTRLWEAEWRKALIQACLKQVRRYLEETTVRAFELTVLERWPADKAAAQLGISRNAVFHAKRRVLSHLREAYRCMEDFW